MRFGTLLGLTRSRLGTSLLGLLIVKFIVWKGSEAMRGEARDCC
jgi:hypothetical protein